MGKNGKWIIGVILLLLIAGGAYWVYDSVLGETEEASGPIAAVPLELEEEPAEAEVMEPEAEVVEEVAATEEPMAEEEAMEEAVMEEEAQPGGLVIYQIDQNAAEVRFNIFEELRGEPVDVIGVSNQVAGEIAIDLADLSATQVGIIQVNARTLATDSDRRNQAIRNFILNTDSFEFITFTPVDVIGLEGSAAVGDSFSFQIAGDLTIRAITQPAVFDVTAEVVGPEQITGSAVTVVLRDDYELTIPDVPAVANVGQDVTLEIDFTLVPIEG